MSAIVILIGNFEITHVPFRLAQVPDYFQRFVNEVWTGLDFTFGYLDDILVFSSDIKTHLKHLNILFQRLREANLKLKESKCNFLKAYIGNLIAG